MQCDQGDDGKSLAAREQKDCHTFMNQVRTRRRKILWIFGMVVLIGAWAFSLWAWFYGQETLERLQEYAVNFKSEQERAAAHKYGKALPEVDEIRLARITEEDPGTSGRTYRPLHNEERLYHEVSQKVLTGEPARELAALWRQMVYDEGNGPACFMPHHVVEFRKDGRVICESLVCFQCGNLSLPTMFGPTLLGFGGFDGPKKVAADQFLAVLDSHLGKHVPKPRTTSKK